MNKIRDLSDHRHNGADRGSSENAATKEEEYNSEERLNRSAHPSAEKQNHKKCSSGLYANTYPA
jgi:hypothetical protein